MNWAKQSEEMLKNWTDSQQKMWDNWMQMMSPMTGQAAPAEFWQQALSTWEQAVKESMTSQADWMKSWADSLDTMPNVPSEFITWAEQAVDMNQQWSKTQEQLWDGWFAMLKNMNPGAVSGLNTGAWEEESKKAMQAWQESAAKVVEANKKFAETWTMFNTTVNGK
ncbi:MAG: hypothetical protein KDD78_01770 [Caldilineaceae bacterium]|nr:hypothetical protein [Caldilineaceae bacterium]